MTISLLINILENACRSIREPMKCFRLKTRSASLKSDIPRPTGSKTEGFLFPDWVPVLHPCQEEICSKRKNTVLQCTDPLAKYLLPLVLPRRQMRDPPDNFKEYSAKCRFRQGVPASSSLPEHGEGSS